MAIYIKASILIMPKLQQNIIIVNDFDYINGGAAKVAIDWARIYRDQGKNVVFFSAVHQDTDLLSEIQYVSTNQQEFLYDKSRFLGALRGLYNYKAYKEFKKLLLQYDPNNTIICIHGWIKALSCSIWNAAWELGFKIQITAHDYFLACPNGGFFNYPQNTICHLKPLSIKCCQCNCDSRSYFLKIYRCIRFFIQNKIVNIQKKTNAIITISNFSESMLKPFFLASVDVIRIPNPVDSIPLTERIKAEENDYYLFVGRLSKEKGCELFCKAICELGLKGVVVGDGSEFNYLKQAYPLLKFVGWKSHADVFEYMKKARALVFPSLWYEAAPLTVPEAMSIGLPCVVSNCCAAKDNVIDDKNGMLFFGLEEFKNQLKKMQEYNFLKNMSINAFSSKGT